MNIESAHVCEPDAEKLIQQIGRHPNEIRILTFWSIEGAYPAGKLRYHLGQLGMLRLMNDLANQGCQVEALLCDSQSRTIVGGSAGDLENDIQTTEKFIKLLKTTSVRTRRMSQLIDDLHRNSAITHQVARQVVNGALSFRNFIQRHPPAETVISGLDRFRSCVQLPTLDAPTEAYLKRLMDEFPSVEQLDLLAALYASVRRPKWFDAFWLGDIAAWVAAQANIPNTVILEADRSAYSWLTHRCFLAIGAVDEGTQSKASFWPNMYFVAPVLRIDGKVPMQLSDRPQAIFLHHTHEGLKDRLARASTASLSSYCQWLKPSSENANNDDVELRKILLSHIESQREPVRNLFTHTISESRRTSTPPDKVSIGLCLSGGGFRATFFHLGLIKLLRDLDLLDKVVGVYSVSGGSILAANLAQRWDKYLKNQDDATFFEAIGPLLDLARANIRGRIIRRLFWFGSRADRLARYYESIGQLQKTELKDLPSKVEFSFLGTSMKTGKLVAFNRHGFDNGIRQFRSTDILLSRAVAASSAFPPLFSPMWLSEKDLSVDPDGKEGIGPVTDGGVYDNLGLTRLLSDAKLRSDERWCTVALVSDASAPFEISGGAKFKSVFSRTARTTDIMMKRMGDLDAAGQSDEGEDDDGVMQIYPIKVKIDHAVDAEILDHFPAATGTYFVQDARVQALTSKIRTDLDVFSNEEVASLVRHGYETGLASLIAAGMVPKGFQPRDPCGVPFPQMDIFKTNQTKVSKSDNKPTVGLIRDCLENSSVRRLGLFDASDWLSWIVLPITILVVWLLLALF